MGMRFCVEWNGFCPSASGMPQGKSSAPGQLAGLMLVSVFALAFTGLFGVWYSHEMANAANEELSVLGRLIDTARQAQVEFKIQVQDWKNLLLRGQNPKDFTNYSERLPAQSATVQETLKQMLASRQLPAELRPEIESIATEHAELLAKYQAAAARYSQTDPATIFAVDGSVRGIDQKLNDRIDRVAAQLAELEARRLAELRSAGEKLYGNLRIAMAVAGLFAICCAVALAWRARKAA